ncbi:acyl-CoA N-acyltransferase [Obelidium mucronatum]|nr:acyl-CoA N-acyltransferase [Obelidium mucronatum]
MIIIRASGSHWAQLSQLAKLTFAETFAHLYSAKDLETHLASNYTEDILRKEIQEELVFFVCDDGDVNGLEPFGFYQLKPNCRHPQLGDAVAFPDPCWELHRFYVKNEKQGIRAGSSLMKFAMEQMKEAGAKSVWLSVFSENTKAQRFYEKYQIQLRNQVREQVDIDHLYAGRFE